MTNKKSIVYVFAMPYGETELEKVEPICPNNHWDYMGIEGVKIEKKYGATICDGHYHFDKPVSLGTIASFIQEMADSMMTKFYFALKKNGRIWIAERTGEDDIIYTPDGPFVVRTAGGNEAEIKIDMTHDINKLERKLSDKIFEKDPKDIEYNPERFS